MDYGFLYHTVDGSSLLKYHPPKGRYRGEEKKKEEEENYYQTAFRGLIKRDFESFVKVNIELKKLTH
jgi:hypothetical protein